LREAIVTAISRREFFKKTAADATVAAILAASVGELEANPLGLPIGSQTYPHRAMIKEGNFAGLCKMMADIGVKNLELCSPSYAEFSSLADGKAVRKILDDHGLKCPSAHFGMNVLRKDQPAMIQWAKDIGMTQMSTASLGGGGRGGAPITMDQVKQSADEYNKIAAEAAKAGLQQALHNEGFENGMVDGRRVYDVLLELLDPKLVKMQFQMSSTRALGIDPVEFFTKHPGRFISLHLQGVNLNAPTTPPAAPAPAPAAAPAGAQAAPGAAPAPGAQGGGRGGGVAVGKDSLDWVKVFKAAKVGGIKNYFVEQNWELTQESVAFLKKLKA
jgi:sugar phosphate isomerase/epimerase